MHLTIIERTHDAPRGKARARPSVTRSPRPVPPPDPAALGAWLQDNLRITLPDRPLIAGNAAPMHYIAHAFFEGAFTPKVDPDARRCLWEKAVDARRTPDCVVWANRGGGKTFLGAVATLLDLVFKAGVQVRILAGSLEQSRRMHDHLRVLFARQRAVPTMRVRITARRIDTGSAAAELLAASQTSVRGTRVQKVRCDEVDLFRPELWTAAQLVTRSLGPCHGPWGPQIRGSIEALSTMHRPHGVMWDLVHGQGDAAPAGPRPPVFRWGVVDTLSLCPVERPCGSCSLVDECAGRAKRTDRTPGHISIDDAIALKRRTGRADWETEMLCLRPRRADAVYAEFDPGRHIVRDGDPRLETRRVVAWYAGMDFGIRGESALLAASLDDAGTLIVERERCASGLIVRDQVETLRDWIDTGSVGPPAWVAIDPAGRSRSDQTGRSSAEIVRSAGWRLLAPKAQIETGLRLVRRRLAPAAPGEPARLLIHERCTRLIECMQRYHYPENRPHCDDPVKDGHDHACDALRYLVSALDRGGGVNVSAY